jgi:16S rRNA (adenine1518-N6/adenine1519-N6)-dimethyltransferase
MWSCASSRNDVQSAAFESTAASSMASMKHIPRKRFGQHFLVDALLINSIVEDIAPLAGQRMVEIGPGLGALTQPLLERLGEITVIELDRDLAAHWRTRDKVHVIECDVLKVDIAGIKSEQYAIKNIAKSAQLRIVGNLPYNISTPILFHLLPYASLIQDQHFMLQKEVIDRMVAQPSTSDYGRLSVMLQWRYEMENFLHVPPEAFDPPPRVQSAVVRMIPREQPAALKPELLEELVKVAFSQRRKILRHTLGRWLEERGFPGEFDVQRRAEEVPVAQYVALAQQC